MFENRLARLAYKSCWKKNRFFCESSVIFSEDEEVCGENSTAQVWQLAPLERDFSAAVLETFQLWVCSTLLQTYASFTAISSPSGRAHSGKTAHALILTICSRALKVCKIRVHSGPDRNTNMCTHNASAVTEWKTGEWWSCSSSSSRAWQCIG